MIIPLVIGCVVGAALISRGSPRTRVKKLTTIGTASGGTYMVEQLPQAGIMIVHAPGCVAVFERQADGSFSFLRGSGDQRAIVSVVRDVSPKDLEKKP